MDSKNDILGLKFYPDTPDLAHERLLQLLKSEKCAKIYTPNPEMAIEAYRNASLSALLNSADLLLPDGTGIVLASKLLSSPLPCRIPGIEAGEFILSVAADYGLPVYFLGGKSGVAAEAAIRMKQKYHGLIICGVHHGYFDFEDSKKNAELISLISSKKPALLFVCLGFPTQEKWIDENAGKIPTLKVAIGLGGSFDIWSGRKKRAPSFVRKAGLEWLWRAAAEPKRLKIFLKIPSFFNIVLRERMAKRILPSEIDV